MGQKLLGSQAYDQIRAMLFRHALAPGQKIVCRDLEEKLALSRTPITNALMKLESEGYLTHKPNKGFYVKEATLQAHVIKVFDLRVKLECIAAEFALEKCTKNDLVKLENCCREYKNYGANVYDERRYELDTEFHMEIARIGENAHFVDLIKIFYDTTYLEMDLSLLTPCIEEFKVDHYDICNALKDGDGDALKRIIGVHTERAKSQMLAQLTAKAV